MEFINLKAMYAAYAGEFDAAWAEHAAGAKFIGGEAVERLEAELASFLEAIDQPKTAAHAAHNPLYALSCSDGTNALIIALKAAGIGAGDEVITSPFTFAATAEAIAAAGATPVFADIGADYTLDPAAAAAAITPRTAAIVAVSLFGTTGSLEALAALAREKGLLLIEDAAQSFGAQSASGRASAALADVSATSFFPSKPLGCFGDGGAIFSRDRELIRRARLLANHGSARRYEHEIVGTNSRLDALQASILRIRLRHFRQEIARRERIAAAYSRELPAGLILPRAQGRSVWAQYSVLAARRDEFCAALGRAGVPTAVHYPAPLHLQPAFGGPARRGEFARAEFAAAHICSLPFSAFLRGFERAQVVAAAAAALSNEAAGSWAQEFAAAKMDGWQGRAAVLGCGKMGRNHIRELLKSGYAVSAFDLAAADLGEFAGCALDFCKLSNEGGELYIKDNAAAGEAAAADAAGAAGAAANVGTADAAGAAGSAAAGAKIAVVAVPTSAHAQAAKFAQTLAPAAALVVEKPLAQSAAEAELIAPSAFVGFNERFASAFLRARNLAGGARVKAAKFLRESPRPARIADVDVAADLASHDLDLAALLGLDIFALRLLKREEDFFAAASEQLEITASWRAQKPRRAALLHLEDGRKIGLDFLDSVIYFDGEGCSDGEGDCSTGDDGEKSAQGYEFFGEKFACKCFCAAFSNLERLHQAALCGRAATADDGKKVLEALEKLKN